MRKILLALAILIIQLPLARAKDYTVHSFKKQQLNNEFWAEGANFGDFNRDGQMDIVCGPYWYEGPDFTKRHEFYPANATFKRKKSDSISARVFTAAATLRPSSSSKPLKLLMACCSDSQAVFTMPSMAKR